MVGVSPSAMFSGASCSLIICLSANQHRLCTSSMDCLAWHAVQDDGSWILPRSIMTSTVAEQAEQRKNPILMSGITLEVRVIMPLTETIWSMSCGLRSRMVLVSRRLNVRTWMRAFCSASSPKRWVYSWCTTRSMMGTISCG